MERAVCKGIAAKGYGHTQRASQPLPGGSAFTYSSRRVNLVTKTVTDTNLAMSAKATATA
jgi:hypothetical protein